VRDEQLKLEILRVWDHNYRVYGADKIWAQLYRERITVARCTVERLMRSVGLKGVVRGRRHRTTTPADASIERPRDLVERAFSAPAPNRLCLPTSPTCAPGPASSTSRLSSTASPA
jgi:putative transposase